MLKEYDDQDLKVVSKHLVVHPQIATDAALATCAANDQGKFAEFEHAIWNKAWDQSGPRKRLNQQALAAAAMHELAADLGLDVQRFKARMSGKECKAKLGLQRQQWRTLGVNGTPAIFVNGMYYVGPRTAAGLKQAVDAELKKVNAALNKGVKLESYYASLIKRGKKTP